MHNSKLKVQYWQFPIIYISNDTALNVMDDTLTGAASGENARFMQHRRVQNLRQKDRRVTNFICYFDV